MRNETRTPLVRRASRGLLTVFAVLLSSEAAASQNLCPSQSRGRPPSADARVAFRAFRESLRNVTIPAGIRHNVFLFRFLEAKNFDVDRAVKMFRAHLEWREKWRPEYLRDEWKLPEVLEKYGVVGFIGYDVEGSPVMLADEGAMDTKGILASIEKDDYLRWFIKELESNRQKLRILQDDWKNGDRKDDDWDDADRKDGGRKDGAWEDPKSQLAIIFEFKGVPASYLLSSRVLDVMLRLVQMHDGNYPGLFKRIYVLNMPPFFAAILGMVKPILRQGTLDKVVCLGAREQYAPVLTRVIPKEVLPKYWGGTRVDENGDPKCSAVIGKGGKVPRSYYRYPQTMADEEDEESENEKDEESEKKEKDEESEKKEKDEESEKEKNEESEKKEKDEEREENEKDEESEKEKNEESEAEE
ncbi:unnamed protein product [Darwinula stevensoni]|uniref:CRAL-TRIO domain-containing protein n=1 Tax=Darwinula stevensoni TaxID=69355 RepID=A0A7R9A4Q6_9CRUS|nr:unnamed protein product [Darwinula stevensoni]CAG0894042.1 unnamed protein product [Darwinula stevensoni]